MYLPPGTSVIDIQVEYNLHPIRQEEIVSLITRAIGINEISIRKGHNYGDIVSVLELSMIALMEPPMFALMAPRRGTVSAFQTG